MGFNQRIHLDQIQTVRGLERCREVSTDPVQRSLVCGHYKRDGQEFGAGAGRGRRRWELGGSRHPRGQVCHPLSRPAEAGPQGSASWDASGRRAGPSRALLSPARRELTGQSQAGPDSQREAQLTASLTPAHHPSRDLAAPGVEAGGLGECGSRGTRGCSQRPGEPRSGSRGRGGLGQVRPAPARGGGGR